MAQDQIVRVTTSTMVAEKIKDLILQHELRPGDRLPTEQELADRFGVSRISVREATKALGFLGIIDSAPRRGLTVGTLDMDRVSRYLGFHFAVSDFPVEQLIDTRVVIETGGLRYTCVRVQDEPDICTKLDEINRKYKEAESNEERFQYDLEFHRQLLAASGIDALVAFHDLIQIFFQRLRASLEKTNFERAADAHGRIVDAVQRNAVNEATELLRVHIEFHKGRI